MLFLYFFFLTRSPVTPMKPLRPLTLDSVDSNVDCQLRSVPGFLTSSPFNDRSHETASTGVQNMLLKNDSLEITSAGGSGFNSSTNPMDCRISIGQLPSWAKAKVRKFEFFFKTVFRCCLYKEIIFYNSNINKI